METGKPTESAPSRLWLWHIAIGLILVVAYYSPLPYAVTSLIYDWFGFSAVVAVVWSIRRRRPAARRAWWLVAAGIALLTAGDLVWNYYELILDLDAPFPSFADALYLAAYPILAAGLLLFGWRRGRGSDRGTVIDAAIIGLSYLVAAWFFFLEPYLNDPTYPVFERVVSAGYPAADVPIVAAVALLLLTPGRRSPAFLLLTVGSAVYVAADVFYARGILTGTYLGGSAMEAVWMLGALCWGAAALHPSARDLGTPGPAREVMLTRRRLALLTTAAIAVPVVHLLHPDHGGADRYVGSGATALLFILVVLRLSGLLRAVDRGHRHFRALVQRGNELITVLDADGTIRYASPSYAPVLGYQPDEAVGRLGVDLIYPEDLPIAHELLAELAESPGAQRDVEIRVRHADGSGRIVAANVINLLHDPDVRGVVINSRDVTDRRHAELALQTSERDLRRLFELAGDAILVFDPSDEVILDANASACTLYGFTREEFIGRSLRSISANAANADPHLEKLLNGSANVSLETVQFRSDGTPLTLAVKASLVEYQGRSAILSINRDVTAQKALEAELAHRAFHDALTGLPNRALFTDRLTHALVRASRRAEQIAVLLLDLDRFKLVNDALGHAAGDRLLIAVGHRLSACLRDADTLARLGGDEFAVLLEDASPETARTVAERVLAALADPILVEGREVYPGTSIGIAVSTPERSAPDELLRAADVALYRAKHAGRGTLVLFDPAAADPTAGWLALEADLRRAVARNELTLHYQPVVSLATGDIVTVEALVRWCHPERGTLPPSVFIPLAEETGLITAITTWAITESLQQLATWRQTLGPLAPPSVNVNLTTRDLRDPDFVERVQHALFTAGLPPSCLRLEVTERVLVEEIQAAAETLRTLRAHGVGLAIDDFGAGASSLASLRSVEAEVLKLDRAFVRGLELGTDDRVVVAAIAAMAHALGMVVTAEGIETPAQLEAARTAGCDRGQGYLFTRPLSPEALATWLITNATKPSPTNGRITVTAETALIP